MFVFVAIQSRMMSYLRVVGMRRVVRVLCLLCNQSWVELLVAVDVSRVNILRRLAVYW